MKNLFAALFICLSVASVHAADVGLVYENEAAVKEGRVIIGAATSEGILVSAKLALTNNATLLMGALQGKLHKAVLLRLDNKLDVAILQPGEEVKSPDLQKAFAERAAAVAAFLPSGTTSAPAAPLLWTGEPYSLRINGTDTGPEPLELLVKKEKSEFELEVVRLSTTVVWFIEIEMTADPQLSFWKKNKEKKYLNDIPRPIFKHSYQGMFVPMTQGKSFKVPIEVYFIKEESYTLNIKVTSKSGSIEKKVSIRFKPQ